MPIAVQKKPWEPSPCQAPISSGLCSNPSQMTLRKISVPWQSILHPYCLVATVGAGSMTRYSHVCQRSTGWFRGGLCEQKLQVPNPWEVAKFRNMQQWRCELEISNTRRCRR